MILKIWGRRILIFILKMFLTLLLNHSLTIVLCYGRAKKVYIRLNLMKFSGQIFYDFLHCYQIKLVWTSWDLIGSSSRLLVNIQLIHFYISLMTPFYKELFLDEWKLARVTPVFKNNGDVDVMSNYRPVSVIGHIAKMVEQLVRSQLVRYLEEHSFITPDQSAYLKGHSTQTSLHRVIDDWLDNINEDQITGVCLLDISKCFDTINHSILLQKLSMYGIKHQELKWFSSYLDNRKQAVLCHNELSCFVDITCGVPQGSVLGPFLFLLFINDISQFTTDGCLTNLYADDSMIYASGDNILQVQQKLQQCVKNISSW